MSTMVYNMTGFEQSNNLLESAVAINNASSNLLVISFMIALFVILLITLLKFNPAPESFTAASGACTVLSIVFLAAEMITMQWVIGFTLVFAMSAVGLYLRNKNG